MSDSPAATSPGAEQMAALRKIGRPWTDRFPGSLPVAAPGTQLLFRADTRCLGFFPPQRVNGLPMRWLGPEPSGMVALGELPAAVRRLGLVVLAPSDPGPLGTIRLHLEQRTLPWSREEAPPLVRAACPEAWLMAADLPDVADRPAAPLRLGIELDRTLPEMDAAPPARFVGLALHALLFLE